jgi:serine/threonine protein phosphatase PrpC
MNYLTAVHTDIGIKKKTNQDSALILEAESDVGNILLTVICDGMGGLAKGEVASSAVIRAFSQWFENELPSILTLENPKDRIFSSWEKIALNCNEKIASYGKSQGVSMGTTLIAVLFFKDDYYIINIGDSRAYCISDNLYQLTKDQTFIQREMDMGRMTYEQAQSSPQRNVLLQCIGASNIIEPDFFTGKIIAGQVFMLCSDGFRHIISEAEIYERFNPYNLINEQAMKDNAVYLTELNKYRQEQDNITVLLVKVW